MKIAQDVRNFAVQQDVDEQAMLQKGMKQKPVRCKVAVFTARFGIKQPRPKGLGIRRAPADDLRRAFYRLYEFRKSPKMFDLPGSVENHCLMNPVSYICEFS